MKRSSEDLISNHEVGKLPCSRKEKCFNYRRIRTIISEFQLKEKNQGQCEESVKIEEQRLFDSSKSKNTNPRILHRRLRTCQL